MADELSIPQVPEAKPEDPEDVSWALSTAEAMWARGDHAEGIKWVRRAAEAASEAENDNRALELAKAAADLQGMLARRSRIASAEEIPAPAPDPEPAPAAAPPPTPRGPTGRSIPPIGKSASPSPRNVPSAPPQKPSAPPAAKPAGSPAATGRSIPPIGAGTKTSQPPGAPAKNAPQPTAPASKAPPAPGSAKSVAPPPAPSSAKSVAPPPSAPASSKSLGKTKDDDKKSRRRSRENLAPEMKDAAKAAKAGAMLETARHPAMKMDDEEPIALSSGMLRAADPASDRHKSPFESDPTVVATHGELDKNGAEADRLTMVGTPPPGGGFAAPRAPAAPIAGAASGRPAARATPSTAPHDPGLQTTQAVRVVVWRDAQGVHVAPAGTAEASRVSAIKIDAVLVALDAAADLTAWLSRQGR